MFGKSKTIDSFARRIVGDWRAEAVSGQAQSVITASFHSDSTFIVRTELHAPDGQVRSITQAGRYRVEPVDKTRFRLFTTDEEGAPQPASVRAFPNANTMVTEIGRLTFIRLT
jgi:hypothetical protein